MTGGRSVVVFAPVFPPARLGGGPIRTLDALVAAAPDDFGVAVLTPAREVGTGETLDVDTEAWVTRGAARVRYVDPRRLRSLAAGYRDVRSTRPEIVYFNSFWHPTMSLLPQLLGRFGYWGRARRVLAPRGEFGPEALRRHAGRKGIIRALYRLLALQRNVIWHASSDTEATHIRNLWGMSAEIVVRENDTALPETAAAPAAPSDATVRLAFVGRIVEIKGLNIALQGLALLESARPVEFHVHGPEEDGEYARLARVLAGRLSSPITVRFHGALEPSRVRATLREFDALVMPTAGENFGHVIAEALSSSCPVLCSDTTPWSDVLRDGGGVVVESRTPERWAEALDAVIESDARTRTRARVRAGEAYARWRAHPKGDHVLDLVARRVPRPARG